MTIKMTEPKIYSRNNVLYLHFSFNGKQERRSLTLQDTKQNRRHIENVIIPEMKKRVYTGELERENSIPTVNEYSEISFENHKNDRKQSTTKDYKSMYNNYVKPYFGDKRLNEIKVSDINKWKNEIYDSGKKLSTKRVNEIKRVLSMILQDSLDDELIKSNPVKKSKPLPSIKKKDKDPFTLNEVQSILDNCTGQTHNMFSLLFFTGMRTGEMIGLKWSDIDFEKETITIQRTIRKGLVGTTKTKSSVRTIPILKVLIKSLKEQFELTGKYNSYVFLNRNHNHYFDSSKIRDGVWKKTVKKSGIRYRTVYNTRHTFVSLNLSNGQNILWVSQMIGHKNVNITLEHYSKYVPVVEHNITIFDKSF